MRKLDYSGTKRKVGLSFPKGRIFPLRGAEQEILGEGRSRMWKLWGYEERTMAGEINGGQEYARALQQVLLKTGGGRIMSGN